MKLPFGKRKPSIDELEKQAGQELEAAVARAKPPTDAERTWVRAESDGDWRERAASLARTAEPPTAPARPAVRRGPLLPRVPGGEEVDGQPEVDGQLEVDGQAATPAPAPAKRAKPRPSQAAAPAKAPAKRAAATSKKAPSGAVSTGKAKTSTTRKAAPRRKG
jgi:hypothetical protein